jgi:hypothetical protein
MQLLIGLCSHGVCITHTLKTFEYRKSGPLDRVIDVTSALELLKPQGLGQQEWFHVFTVCVIPCHFAVCGIL